MISNRRSAPPFAVALAVALASPLAARAIVPPPLPLGCRLVLDRSAQRLLAVQIVNTTSRALPAGTYVAWDVIRSDGGRQSQVVQTSEPVGVGGTESVGRITGAASACTASTPRPVVGRAPVHS